MTPTPSADRAKRPMRSARRWLPVAVLAAGFAAFFAFGLDQYLSFEALRAHRVALHDFIAAYPVSAPLLFMAVYAVAVAFSLPGGAVLSITAGFLFGTLAGTAYVVASATVGAVVIFLVARTAFGEPLRAKAGPWLRKLEDGFRRNALSYLLVLRLMPVFPFFVVNLVPAMLGVSLRTYTIGTVVGIIPGSFVFASVGTGLGSIFDAGHGFTPTGILTPEIIAALTGLSLLSLLPVAYKAVKARRA